MSTTAATLAEAYPVLRLGGSLLLLDHLERRWRHGRPATIAARAGFAVVERQLLGPGTSSASGYTSRGDMAHAALSRRCRPAPGDLGKIRP